MADNRISSMEASDLSNSMTDFNVNTADTDGILDQKETEYINADWQTQFGYYTDEKIPEITSVIDAKATWTVGKGFQADQTTTLILDSIKGFGKDTFNTILENMLRVKEIGGDSFAEIIRNEEKSLVNLKPLNPSKIKIIANRKGIITRYEQIDKINKGKVLKKFKPEEILHFSRNRVSDEMHGRGIISKLKLIMDMKNEAMQDMRTLMHRHVIPRWKFKLKTDDVSEIAAYKAKQDAATGAGENIYEPFDTSESELLAVAPNATLSPLAWIESLDAKFYEAANVPKIIVGGGGGFTEAAVKIAYLAFQQTIEEEQLYAEEQIGMQLGLKINLEFPASLENELLSDNKKDGAQNIDPSEMTAGEGQ